MNSMPKQKKKKGIFFLLSFFFSLFLFLSFFGMHLIFIFQLWIWGLGLFPVTNLLYLDLEHNFLKQKMMYREKKIRKKKHFIMSQYLQEKYKNYFFSQKTFGAWFFPSITEHSFMRLVELWRVTLAEKPNLKIFFADKGTLTSSTWRLVSCDCMLLERSN